MIYENLADLLSLKIFFYRILNLQYQILEVCSFRVFLVLVIPDISRKQRKTKYLQTKYLKENNKIPSLYLEKHLDTFKRKFCCFDRLLIVNTAPAHIFLLSETIFEGIFRMGTVQ